MKLSYKKYFYGEKPSKQKVSKDLNNISNFHNSEIWSQASLIKFILDQIIWAGIHT